MDFPNIDPIIFSIGPFELFGMEIGPIAARWYGLTYVIGLLGATWLAKRKARLANSGWTEDQVSDFLFYGFLCAVLGGRIGYVFFYQFERFAADFSYLFQIMDGGMSFHGGLLGVAAFMIGYGIKNKRNAFEVADFFAPFIPIGLGAGRIGNFINSELWGREVSSDFFLAMKFPTDPLGLYRHPSQLYEFALEGAVLFALLMWFSKRARPAGSVAGLFLIGYGTFRFLVEFFREPDSHLNLVLGPFSMGQLLSTPMIIAGLGMMIWAYRFNNAKRVAA
jgi:phosphatidylglycerol---prolipoprotein diacylglyceryl transferase